MRTMSRRVDEDGVVRTRREHSRAPWLLGAAILFALVAVASAWWVAAPEAPSPAPAATSGQRSPAARAVEMGAQALGTAAMIQQVAQETAERVAAETAARVSKQYEAAIAELTKTLDKNTKRALKSVRTAADLAQAANPVKPKKGKKKG